MSENSESPYVEPPLPPGDFTNDPVFRSPSTWLTLSTYLLPLFTLIFKDNADAVLQAVVGLGPLVATAVLVIQRNGNHRNVQQLNAGLAAQRMNLAPAAVAAQVASASRGAETSTTPLLPTATNANPGLFTYTRTPAAMPVKAPVKAPAKRTPVKRAPKAK